MIKRIEQFFLGLSTKDQTDKISQNEIHLATAALLVEVATIDQSFDADEWQQLHLLLMSQCDLTAEEANELIKEAQQASANSVSLFDFTQLINMRFEYPEKLRLVENFWEIAYADGSLDKYEEHIIRRITDLIHVSHKDFILLKNKVRDERR
jgi:uncharacterized tellurite resistance protein B-like protein